ncbi:protein kinase [Ophiostoma piceae UAMH 11346]|uniref:EKC/KEOPS complex subunit BUD32 n=1 Tax=Ophiostoma piceae (strain UAMH 11346) TaxID=1262450 RepID=S3BN50_OPHP1|nr:protein kinase [Ophiostoma piceae UAMH 11346]
MATQPKVFLNIGFETLPSDELIEEERLPGYKAEWYYPARIGQVLQDRYQIVGKLGYGGGSTVWACRDLVKDTLLAIKICTAGERGGKDALQEVAISDYIKSIDAPHHPGKQRLRVVLDNFEIGGLNGNRHQCLVFSPLGATLTRFRKFFPGRTLQPDGLRLTLLWVILGLDFLHQAGVIHTDLSPNNILVSFAPGEERVFNQIEDLELATPTPRKVLPNRSVYLSYELGKTNGPAVITDFGAARLGDPENDDKHSGDVMPGTYRAPEIIMGADWDSKIDMWSLGVMVWDLFEGGSLFRAVVAHNLDDELHLAEMVSLLGPPPKKFLDRYERSRQYWDSEGNWIASTPIPDQTLEIRETKLKGEEKQQLLAFVRKVLCWLPEDRKSADQLYRDAFVNGYERHKYVVATGQTC